MIVLHGDGSDNRGDSDGVMVVMNNCDDNYYYAFILCAVYILCFINVLEIL